VPLENVWAWFNELDQGRGANGAGPAPLSWPLLDAWRRVTGARPTAYEARLLLELDRVAAAAGKKKEPA
jgi:hypothetical protein